MDASGGSTGNVSPQYQRSLSLLTGVYTVGNLPGFHTAVAVHPGSSYGIIILMAGSYPDAAELAYDAFEIMQPGIDRALSDLATELYAGKWVAVHSIQNATEASSAIITVEGGTLYIDTYILFGVNALEKMEAKGRVALRPTRRDEFRCVIMFFM